MIKRLEVPGENDDGPFWKSITIKDADANGAHWNSLKDVYHRQIGHSDKKIRVFWRNAHGEHIFIFSPRASLAEKERLKGLPLKKIKDQSEHELVAKRFSWNDSIA
jgi:hypothetical protein